VPIALCPQVMTCVYRLYDADGRLLYVGIAYDFDVRFKQHAYHKDWWPLVARKDIIWFDNRIDALHDEARAIANEGPIYNTSKGAHPIGMAIIHRQQPTPYSVPRYWGFPGRERDLSLSKDGKRTIIEEIECRKSHAAVTVEGELVGVVVPMEWYLRALAKVGEPTALETLPRVDVEEFWGSCDLASA
jgi:predicted GIY-YIG superfamily endonuclease